MAAYGLYTHIQSNRRRSVMLLIGLFFLVYLMVFAGALLAEGYMGGNRGFDSIVARAWRDLIVALPFATIGAAIWIAIAWKFHQAMIDALTGGHEVTRREEPRLYNLLENLCISRGIPMPKLKIMDSDALNAFATGLNEKQYSITVTTGLLNKLNDAEIEAVLAHELTHIRNGDVRMMVIAVIIAGVISFFAEFFFRVMFRGGFRGGRSSGGDNRKGGGGAAILIAVVLVAVAWFLSLVIRFALSRSREFLADAGAVELTKNPDAMIVALRKIEGRGELPGVTSAVMEMCVDNPRSGFADLFASHPSIDRRVDALVRMAGGHDPGLLMLPEPDHIDAATDEPSQNPDNPSQQGPWQAPQGTPQSDASRGSAPSGPSTGPWGPVRDQNG
ncbi:M48 family metallopeptidase [Pseudorhodoplanes sinuspersici]|uniref:Protease HtpX homolog n=1 Tax=Pseudorhodoplanes sinuspersici TaxID=1235591 RepID=A0A1W6ZR26_9HYPH|nr:M48 family metallopeptidase [Pseudorhodoplanes sinuspersici]ARP99570.1 peptidase M48 Ste24p [Pseudorhodoplanes sinuspersici]RKE70539.1 heat shock protein [Pseudorhodoplanes sinuspersici]